MEQQGLDLTARQNIPHQEQVLQLPDSPSNAEIIGHAADAFAPTLRETSSEPQSRTIRYVLEIWDKLPQVPLGIYVSWSWLPQIRLLQQLNLHLPRRLQQPASHVYFVTAPHHEFPSSFRHWSIYTQGRFYHLSVDERPNKAASVRDVSSSSCGPGATPATLLKIQNLSDHQQPEYVDAKTGRAATRVFIAFEIGQTMYRPEHIEQLGRWLISKLASYDVMEVNCQIFNMALLERIIMTQRDGSVFAGNLAQLVDWDLSGRSMNQAPSSSDDGFLLRRPGLEPETLRHRLAYLWSSTRNISSAKRIQVLYQKGPLALRAYKATGQHEEWAAIGVLFKQFVRDSKQDLVQALGEFCDDVRARRWTDAFLGREESLNRRLEEQKRKKEQGARCTMPQIERTLLSLRRLLQSSNNES